MRPIDGDDDALRAADRLREAELDEAITSLAEAKLDDRSAAWPQAPAASD